MDLSSSKQKTKVGEVKHGVYLWLKSGIISPSIRGHKRIQKFLRDTEQELLRDMGGQNRVTMAQQILIQSTMQAYGIYLLMQAWVSGHSIIREDLAEKGILELQPMLGKSFLSYMNTIRQNLQVLGLDNQAERLPLTPKAIEAEIIQEKKKDGSK